MPPFRTASFVLLVVFLLHRPGYADCPAWMDSKDIPVCPQGDNTVLPDTYPAIAHVVSDDRYFGNHPNPKDTRHFVADYVAKLFQASGSKVPYMVLPVSDDTYEYVQTRLAQVTKNPDLLKKRLAALVHIKDAQSFRWQQDYFESFVGKEGNAVLRSIRDYNGGSEAKTVSKITQSLNRKCDRISLGSSLPPTSETKYEFGNYASGGNIEGLPGGLCLHGRNQNWSSFTKHYCGSITNNVSIDTSWLKVGHVDEVVSVVKKPNGKSPCDFAVNIASPMKALELLKAKPTDSFLRPFDKANAFSPERLEQTRNLSTPIQKICNLVALKRLKDTPRKKKAPENHGSSSKPCSSTKLAGAGRILGLATKVPEIDCSQLTNGDVASAIEESSNLLIANQLIENQMELAEKTIAVRLKDRLPECFLSGNSIEFIKVPNLFYGARPLSLNGGKDAPVNERFALPEQGYSSILPNPTNAVHIENTVILSEPHNNAFRDYLKSTNDRLGLRTDFLDTFHAAHLGQGNLHCSSHAIRFCNPAK